MEIKMKEFVCIVCPNSCRLTVSEENGEIKVTGNKCKRGEEHGTREYINPMRMLTSTIVVEDGEKNRISVVSSDEIPKVQLMDCLKELYKTKVKAPIYLNDVIANNILGTGVDIVAAQTVLKKENEK